MTDVATTEAATETATTETVEVSPAAETTLVTEGATTEAEATTEATAETETTETTTEAEAEVVGAPEAYTDFTMPEGIELDGELTDQFKATAKELNLTQEQAQKVVELGAKMRQRDAETIVSLRQAWVDETKKDAEIGGDKLDATLATAKRGLDAYGSPQFTKLLNESGLGNHPEVVRFMAKVGSTVAEDKVVSGGDSTTTPQGTLARRLYGTK